MGASLKSLLVRAGREDECVRAAVDALSTSEENAALCFELKREQVIQTYTIRKALSDQAGHIDLSTRTGNMLEALRSRSDEKVRLNSVTHAESKREILIVTDVELTTILGVLHFQKTEPREGGTKIVAGEAVRDDSGLWNFWKALWQKAMKPRDG